MRISVIIPTLNAGESFQRLLDTLKNQNVKPDEILIVDSQSTDDTCETARKAGVRLIEIERRHFDHGGTRDMAFRKAEGDIVIFMTQDALPASPDWIGNLIAPLQDPQVAAVGGRQTAYPNARPFEKLVRAHNYPAENRVWGTDGIQKYGIRAFMISDVCAAYRREAYLAVGGFDHPVLISEDMLLAERFIRSGYKLAYSAEAVVLHSHHFTFRQEFARNYRIGRVMQRYSDRLHQVKEIGTGTTLVRVVMQKLIQEKHFAECFCFAFNCAARLLGNRLGRYHEALEGKKHAKKA